MTIRINLDLGELPKVSETVARAVAIAMQEQAARLAADAFAAAPRTPPRPSSSYWRPHDTAWGRPLHPNCRSVVMPIEPDYIEVDYTVGDATRIAGLLGTDGP